jgi:hypothetical protein
MGNIDTYCKKCDYPNPKIVMDNGVVIFVCVRCGHESQIANGPSNLEIKISQKILA